MVNAAESTAGPGGSSSSSGSSGLLAPPNVPPGAPQQKNKRSSWLLALAVVLGLLVLLVVLVAGGTRWLLATDAGTLWLLQRLPMVQVKGYKGALLGDQWRADSLRVEWAGGAQWLLIEGLAVDGLRWRWRPNPQAWVALAADRMVATKLTIHTGPPSGQPFKLPARVAPPLMLALGDVRIATAQINALQPGVPFGPLALKALTLDPRPGAEHSVDVLSFQGFGVQVEGALRMGNAAPLPLTATAAIRPATDGDNPRWAAVLQASGAVEQLDVSGTLRGRPVAALQAPKPQGRTASATATATATATAPAPAPEAPVVDLRARVRPLQAWPLVTLDLQTQALDLAALWAGGPSTRLAGKAQVQGGSDGQPLQAVVDITNALPGPVNEQRLPLQKLTLQVQGLREQPDRVEVKQFALLLADAQQRSAGRWSGSAVWQGQQLQLDTVLANIAPQRLDGRAAAMTLSGPVQATLRGLPSPDFRAKPVPVPGEPGAASRPPTDLHIDWKLALTGQLDAAPQTVQLKLAGSADANHLELTSAQAQAGNARADFTARLSRAPLPQRAAPASTASGARPAPTLPSSPLSTPAASPRSTRPALPPAAPPAAPMPNPSPWQLVTKGSVRDVDPLPWWPGDAGAAGAAWRKGPHRFSGDWQFDVRLPPMPSAAAQKGRATGLGLLLPRVAGNGSLQIRDSLLAGVPLQADIALAYAAAGSAAANASADATASAIASATANTTANANATAVTTTASATTAPTTAPGARPAAAPGSLRIALLLAGNQLTLDAHGDPAGDGGNDRLRMDLSAGTLATLAPLAALSPALAAWAPRQGSATATALVDGRWPQLRSQGSVSVAQLQAGKLGLAQARATWKLDTSGEQSLTAQADLSGLAYGTQRADNLHADLSGTLAAHRILVSGAVPLAPPPAAEQLLGLQTQQGTRAVLQATGAWISEPDAAAGGGRWRAQIQRLLVGAWDGTSGAAAVAASASAVAASLAPARPTTAGTPNATPGVMTGITTGTTAAPRAATQTAATTPASTTAAFATTPSNSALTWAEARDLRAELLFDGDGKLLALQADPGRVRLASTTALRWDAIHVDLRGAVPLLAIKAEVEPFAVAPLLARLQPSVGWAGDLALGARLDIRAGERMEADIVLDRKDGDLAISPGSPGNPGNPGNPAGAGSPASAGTPAEGRQLLGLTDLRLAVSAHDGVWTFNPVLRGRSLGDISGQVRVTTTPERRWPHATAPMQGNVQARVADIGIWSAWVPPGWRLGGEMRTTAAVGGSFGAPQYTGEITADKLALRNLLQGVNVSDGQVLIKLQGDTAQVERFAFKGGDGTLAITGGATLGAKPQARLQIKAERFRVLGRVDRQLIASGDATAVLQSDSARVDGNLRIDEGLIDASRGGAPSLDDDVTVRKPGQELAERRADAAAAAGKQRFNLALAMAVDLGNDLRVRGYGVDTALRGQLRLANPGGRLQVFGTVRTQGGNFAAYGQKLDIERGEIAFNGPLDNPRLDVLALRPNIDQRVGAIITGNLLTYRLRLYAEPEMSDNDKLSWLVLGRAPDTLGRSDTALLQRAAVALFAGEGEAPTDTLMKSLGIDDVSLRQGEGDVRETVITIGKQISRRWYVGYERGVNSTTGTWQLIYRIAQRLTVRLQSGLENAVDVVWTWRLQEAPPDGAMRKSTIVPR